MKPRNLRTLVESQPSLSRAAHRSSGFTLLEIQIAIVILAVAMIGMIGHGRVYEQILTHLQSEHRFDGVAIPATDRVVVTVSEVAGDTSPPRCEVALESITAGSGTVSADVSVTRRTP